MVRKLIVSTVAVAFFVLAPAGIAQASNGADDPAGHHHHADDGPDHH